MGGETLYRVGGGCIEGIGRGTIYSYARGTEHGDYDTAGIDFCNVTPKIIMVTGAVQTAYRLTAQGMGFSFVSELGLKKRPF